MLFATYNSRQQRRKPRTANTCMQLHVKRTLIEDIEECLSLQKSSARQGRRCPRSIPALDLAPNIRPFSAHSIPKAGPSSVAQSLTVVKNPPKFSGHKNQNIPKFRSWCNPGAPVTEIFLIWTITELCETTWILLNIHESQFRIKTYFPCLLLSLPEGAKTVVFQGFLHKNGASSSPFLSLSLSLTTGGVFTSYKWQWQSGILKQRHTDSTRSLQIEKIRRYGLPARCLGPHPFQPTNGAFSQSSSWSRWSTIRRFTLITSIATRFCIASFSSSADIMLAKGTWGVDYEPLINTFDMKMMGAREFPQLHTIRILPKADATYSIFSGHLPFLLCTRCHPTSVTCPLTIWIARLFLWLWFQSIWRRLRFELVSRQGRNGLLRGSSVLILILANP